MDDDLLAQMNAFQACIENRDAAAADRVLDSGYALMLVTPARAVVSRDAWLEMLADYIVHAYDVDEQLIDVDGDTAAVLSLVRQQATVLGQDRSGPFVLTDVWRRRSDGWRVWRRHSTPFTAGRMPGA